MILAELVSTQVIYRTSHKGARIEMQNYNRLSNLEVIAPLIWCADRNT